MITDGIAFASTGRIYEHENDGMRLARIFINIQFK